MNRSSSAPRRRLSRGIILALAGLAAVMVVARLALPTVLLHQINRRLSRIPGYTGKVDSIGLHLLHGGYSAGGLVIRKRDSPTDQEPFVAVTDLAFTIAYRELLHGRFVSDVAVTGGALNFVHAAAPQETQDLGHAASAPGKAPAPDQRWQDVVHDLFPIDIAHFELHDGRLHYIDTTNRPRIDLAVDRLEVEATGLRNRAEPGGAPLPAQIALSGQTVGGGRLQLHMAAEPLAVQPHFQLKLSLENVSLPALNDFLLAYGSVDVSKGTFQLYTEITGVDGGYRGYVKPLFTDLDFKTRTDEQKNPFQILWKDLVAATTKLLRDKRQKQVATIVPFSGRFQQNTDVRVGTTISNLLRNGFIETIRRGLEGNPAATTEKKQG